MAPTSGRVYCRATGISWAEPMDGNSRLWCASCALERVVRVSAAKKYLGAKYRSYFGPPLVQDENSTERVTSLSTTVAIITHYSIEPMYITFRLGMYFSAD